jgi:Transposase
LEQQVPIDLLEDATAESLATWLERHPTVEVISRDRGTTFAEGATRGAPQALQMADRWHIIHNLSEALEKVLARHHANLKRMFAPEEEHQVIATLDQQALARALARSQTEQQRQARRERRLVLGCVCKSQPEHDRGKSDHRQEIDRPLLIASRDAPKLLEPIDQAFNVITLFVQGSVKRPGARLIAAARNGIANSSALEIVPNLATAVSFISQDPLWPQLGTPSSHPLDRALLHQYLHFGGLMALTSREHKGHRFAFAFCTQMQLRAKTTLTLA